MRQAYVVTGSVIDGRTVALDESLPVQQGKVRLVVEVVEPEARMTQEQFLGWLTARQQARGHVPRTREEVDAAIKAERESWDD